MKKIIESTNWGFIVPGGRQLARLGAIGQHGPNLPRATRVDSKTRWRPSGAQLGRSLRPGHASTLHLASGGVHNVNVVVVVGRATEGQ